MRRIFMFCPKCGSQLENSERRCSNCGYELPERYDTASPMCESKDAVAESPNKTTIRHNPAIKMIFFILSGIVLIMSLYSAHCIASGGLNISSIESVGGQTLEEAYYQYSGLIYTGYAAIIRTTGIFFASVLAYLGIKG